MAATLGNGNITFGDSTVQSTAAVPLTGGTMTGTLELVGSSPQIKMTDNAGTNTGDFFIHVNESTFYILPDRESNGAFETPYALQLDAINNVGYVFGNTILHTNNYSSYAVPLSGGTMTGTLVNNVSIKSKIFYDIDDEAYYLNPASNSALNTVSANKVTSSSANAGPFISLTQFGAEYLVTQDYAAIVINSENPNQANPQITFKKTGTTNGWIDSDGWAYMRRFVDLDNSAYYLDPSNTSYLNALSCASGINSTSTNSFDTFSVKPYSKTMTLSTAAQNVFTANDGVLAPGVYIFTLDDVSDWSVGGQNSNMTYTGLFFWFAGSAIDTEAQQIYTASMGRAAYSKYINFRVLHYPGGMQAFQMWGPFPTWGAYTYNFRFKRIM